MTLFCRYLIYDIRFEQLGSTAMIEVRIRLFFVGTVKALPSKLQAYRRSAGVQLPLWLKPRRLAPARAQSFAYPERLDEASIIEIVQMGWEGPFDFHFELRATLCLYTFF